MDSFKSLEETVLDCGNYAVERQKDIVRNYKSDGSVLTEADLYIDACLRKALRELFPEATIISEESATAPQTVNRINGLCFVIDPIDGTDVYSQGLPSWCIAVGIIDAEYQPVGAVIYAPRWGTVNGPSLLLSLFPGRRAEMNGEPLIPEPPAETARQIVISSKSHRHFNLTGFRGKYRIFGSNILHLISPVLYRHIDAAVCTSGYIWDIAAAHAILQHCGLTLEHFERKAPFTYSPETLNRNRGTGYLLAGSQQSCAVLRRELSLLSGQAQQG